MTSANGIHPNEKTKLGQLAGRIRGPAGMLGIVGLLASVGWGVYIGDEMRRFFHSFLLSYAYWLSIGLGALFFVILQHLVRARWSIVVRRLAELLTAPLGVLLVLGFVIIGPMVMGNHSLYSWTNEAVVKGDHLLEAKSGYLSAPFFAIRLIGYFVIWIGMARYFSKKSIEQDQSGDPKLSDKMRVVSGPSMIVFALTLNFAAFDLLMSLDPHWFSTIFGVYYFAGCAMSIMATLALVGILLQRAGRVQHSITVEHYHDLGKLMFAFIFFWGYIAFSQFMLIWYANVPEETIFFRDRMYTQWKWISLVLLFFHFIFPFVCLLSRWTKRKLHFLTFFCCWMLLMQWFDMYWLVIPSGYGSRIAFNVMDVTTFIGIGGLFVAAAAHAASKVHLIPIKDPHLKESLKFENF